MKVIMTRGLPASGKTWWAKNYQSEHLNTTRVNKDDLRSMMHLGKWSKQNEKLVLAARDAIIGSSLQSGYDVIVDDTNFEKKHIDAVSAISMLHSAEFEIKDFYTPVEDCIERDSKRAASVGREVIMSMWRRYVQEPPKAPEYIEGAKHVILCDIDGTLAKKGDRDIYDGSKAHLDTLILPVFNVISAYQSNSVNQGTGNKVIFMSGRSEDHRHITRCWLESNYLDSNNLFMRKSGDKRSDYIVKKELYEEHIKGKYNVDFVLDDRKQVKRMWVSEGLFVLDVNQTDEEF